jgi:hypothetical protein
MKDNEQKIKDKKIKKPKNKPPEKTTYPFGHKYSATIFNAPP